MTGIGIETPGPVDPQEGVGRDAVDHLHGRDGAARGDGGLDATGQSGVRQRPRGPLAVGQADAGGGEPSSL